MKHLIALIIATTFILADSSAQQHAVGIHFGGMPIYSIGSGINYLYRNKRHQVGAAIGFGEYGIINTAGTGEFEGSHSFGYGRVFYNRVLGKDPIGLYLGGGAHYLHIPQQELKNINALLGDVHVGVSFVIRKRLLVNLEQAFAVGPTWGAQYGNTDFGKEIRNTVQTGSYFPFTVNLYYLLHK